MTTLQDVMWVTGFQKLDCWESDWRSQEDREKTQRKGSRCKVKNDAAEGPVVKTMKALLAPWLRKEKGSVDNGSVSVPRD